MKTRVLTFINPVNGVGTTTTVANIGYTLSKMDKKVLLIDLDPQAMLAQHCGLEKSMETDKRSHPKRPLEDLFKKEIFRERRPEYRSPRDYDDIWEYIEKPRVRALEINDSRGWRPQYGEYKLGVDVIRPDNRLDEYSTPLYVDYLNNEKTVFRLRNIINEIVTRMNYDYILIDAGGHWTGLTINALAAASAGIVVVMNKSESCYKAAELFIPKIKDLQRHFHTLLQEEQGDRDSEFTERIYIINNLSILRMSYFGVPVNLAKCYDCVVLHNFVQETQIFRLREFAGAIHSGEPCSYRDKRLFNVYFALADELDKEITRRAQWQNTDQSQRDLDIQNAEKSIRRINIAAVLYDHFRFDITRKELSEKTGIKLQRIAQLERPGQQDKDASSEELEKIADVLGCTVEFLIHPDN